VAENLRRGGFLKDIGEQNLYPAKSRPAEALFPRLDKSICANCPHRLFRTCQTVSSPANDTPQRLILEGALS
jgi:SulP family sulfate permease